MEVEEEQKQEDESQEIDTQALRSKGMMCPLLGLFCHMLRHGVTQVTIKSVSCLGGISYRETCII